MADPTKFVQATMLIRTKERLIRFAKKTNRKIVEILDTALSEYINKAESAEKGD